MISLSSGCEPLRDYGDRGWVKSPNYPNEYYNDLDCRYEIEVPEGMLVVLTVVNLHIERYYDKLQVILRLLNFKQIMKIFKYTTVEDVIIRDFHDNNNN